MKIRTDFVTNSSSSSFIVSIKNDCTNKIESPAMKFLINDFIHMINENGIKLDSDKLIMDYLKEVYDYYDTDLQILVDNDTRTKFEKLLNNLNNDFSIYYLRLVDQYSDLHSLLENMPNDNNFQVEEVIYY